MNIEQAKEAIKEGKKISNDYFLDYEFIYFKDNKLFDEENNELDWNMFWGHRIRDVKWFIYTPFKCTMEMVYKDICCKTQCEDCIKKYN